MKKTKENARRIKAMAVGIAAVLCMSSVPFHAHASFAEHASVNAINVRPPVADHVISTKEQASILQIKHGVDAVNFSIEKVNRDIGKVELAVPAAGAAAGTAQAKYAEFKPLIEKKAINIDQSPARAILADAEKAAGEQYEAAKALHETLLNEFSGGGSQSKSISGKGVTIDLSAIKAKTRAIDECKDQYIKATAETRNLVEKSDAFEKASDEAVEKRQEAGQAIDAGWESHRELEGNMQDLSESVAAAQAAPAEDAAEAEVAAGEASGALESAQAAYNQVHDPVNDPNDERPQAQEALTNLTYAQENSARAQQKLSDLQAYEQAGSPNAEVYGQLSDAVASGLDQDCAAVSRELETAQEDLQNSEIPLYNEVVDDEKKEIIKDAEEQLQEMDKDLADLEEVQKETDELIQKAEKAIADADGSPAGRPADVTDPTIVPTVGYASTGYDYQARGGVLGVRTGRQNNRVAGVRKEEKKDSAVKEEKKEEQQTIKKIKDNEVPLAEVPYKEQNMQWLWLTVPAIVAVAVAGWAAYTFSKRKTSDKYKK